MIFVCLDIGNVLVNADYQIFLKQLSKSLNLTLEEAMYFMNRTQKLHDLGCTLMADELHDHFKIHSPVVMEELINAWNSIITPNKDVLDKLNWLIGTKDLQVALLSNIGIEHAKQIPNILGHNDFFDKTIRHFSCEVGARKPSVLYYQSFLQLHPEYKGCAYIDDLQENLDASKQFGFRTFRFALSEIKRSDHHSSIKELEKFILEQPSTK